MDWQIYTWILGALFTTGFICGIFRRGEMKWYSGFLLFGACLVSWPVALGMAIGER